MANSKLIAAKAEAPPIARHEFGHYVIARVLGFKVGDVSLTMKFGGHDGSSVIEPASTLTSIDDIENYIENRIIVLYAGALAETLHNGKVDKLRATEIMKTTASNDYAKTRELTHILRSITCQMSEHEHEINGQYKEITDRLWPKAAEMVEEESDLIFNLGSALTSRIVKLGEAAIMRGSELDSLQALKDRFSEAIDSFRD